MWGACGVARQNLLALGALLNRFYTALDRH
jgi:hypothetical protein